MAHLKPQIPDEFDEIVASFTGKVKLKNYFADTTQYSSFSQYIEKYAATKKRNLAGAVLDNSRLQLIAADEMLWSTKQYALLIILQGMDTSGKDCIISHVLSGVNPQYCRVASFKVPTAEEHAHDFLWRYAKQLPERGEIVIFNRSHYEDVLVTRVHPELMEELPGRLGLRDNKNFWADRYEDINAFEQHLSRNGTLILKFFLHISKDEQKARLLKRVSKNDKLWKASKSDFKEREYWDDYIAAYEDMLSKTSTEYAPWVIVPSNDKQISHAIVAHSIAGAVNALKISYPDVSKADVEFLQQAKHQLETE